MKKKNILLYFAIVIFISIGPIFNALPIKLIFLIFILFLYILKYRRIRINTHNKVYFFLLLLFVLSTLITCYVNDTLIPLLFTFTFTISFFCATQFTFSEIKRAVEILSIVFKYAIILAWIGYIYSLFAPPWFSLKNPNGTLNNFYFTTFSVTGSPIRPSAFYDEPGAFSFFICLLVSLRTFLGLDLKTSIFLLVGGIITQSLAHGVFMLVWFASVIFTNDTQVKVSLFKRLFILFSFCGVAVLVYKSGIIDWAIERTQSWAEDPDSIIRFRNYNNVLVEISENMHNLLFGFNHNCVTRIDCEGYSENVLTPIAMGGLMASWPFYLLVGFCFIYPVVTFKHFSFIGIGLLLLQRPYFLELPYCFCMALLIVLFFEINRKNKNELELNHLNESEELKPNTVLDYE